MINFEVNQQVSQKISKKIWEKWINKIQKNLKIKKKLEISIAVVGDSAMKKLNAAYRGMDKTTDVLSFGEGSNKIKFDKNYLGEIIICYPQAARQAKKIGHSVNEEIELLLVHGFLHLLGYDHEKKGESEVMRGLEERIMN